MSDITVVSQARERHCHPDDVMAEGILWAAGVLTDRQRRDLRSGQARSAQTDAKCAGGDEYLPQEQQQSTDKTEHRDDEQHGNDQRQMKTHKRADKQRHDHHRRKTTAPGAPEVRWRDQGKRPGVHALLATVCRAAEERAERFADHDR